MTPVMTSGIIILVLAFAFLGGLANALLAWLNQKPRPPFDWGSFAASCIIALGAAAVIAEGFNYGGFTNNVLACISAFILGMGLNSGVSHVSGLAIKQPSIGQYATGIKPRFIPGSFYRRK